MTTVTFVPEKLMPETFKFKEYSFETNDLPQLTDIIRLHIEDYEADEYIVTKRTFFIKERRWELVLDNQKR